MFASAVAFMALIAIVTVAPAASASAAPFKSILNPTSSHSATDVTTTAWPITPPAAFPRDTPCYREEVGEYVYETGRGELMYEFHFGANVCIFSDRVFVYEPESVVVYPNGQPDPRLASVTYSARDVIRPLDANDVYTFSDLTVIFCPDLPQPSACQQYRHLLGLQFTRGWVYPYSQFARLS
ncbi:MULTISPECIES: hypothetical protein [Saccharothrix]|uniref:hypothetical protein n=1 Tax=Saccharothrix TaxID=2071 RepID=UPI001161514D|nr:hypothetical protein [Saccharothrix sp. CB00851]